MKIEVASTAGFCFGVDRAVNTVYQLLEEGKQAATLGPIIHNPQVIGEFESRGVRIVNTPEETSWLHSGHPFPRRAPRGGGKDPSTFHPMWMPLSFCEKNSLSWPHPPERERCFAGGRQGPPGSAGNRTLQREFCHKNAEELVELLKIHPNWRRNPWHLPLKQRFIRENGKMLGNS